MKKVAVCFSGQPRFADIGCIFNRQYFETEETSVDYYLHTWDTQTVAEVVVKHDEDKLIRDLNECYPFKRIEITGYNIIDEWLEENPDCCYWGDPEKQETEYEIGHAGNYQAYGMFFSAYRSFKLLEDNYDIVYRMRLDCAINYNAAAPIEDAISWAKNKEPDGMYTTDMTLKRGKTKIVDILYFGSHSASKMIYEPILDIMKFCITDPKVHEKHFHTHTGWGHIFKYSNARLRTYKNPLPHKLIREPATKIPKDEMSWKRMADVSQKWDGINAHWSNNRRNYEMPSTF